MTRVVLDPNVLISALLSPAGAPAELARRCLAGDFELVASEQLLLELERALGYSKIRERISKEEAQEYLAFIRQTAELVTDLGDPPRRSADTADDYLLALAATARAAIVSGDRHLLAFSTELPVFTPRDFLEGAG